MLSITSELTRRRSGSPRGARRPRRCSCAGRRGRPPCRPPARAARPRRRPRTPRRRARARGSHPASRTPSSATVTRSARAPGSIRPASGQPRHACPSAEAARISSSAPWRPRSPLARRSSSSTARASSNMSITACESLPSDSDAPASLSRRIGPIPSARSRSVVGHTQQHEPRPAEQAHVVVVEMRCVHRGEVRGQRAGLVEQRRWGCSRRRPGTPRSRRAARTRARAGGGPRSAAHPATVAAAAGSTARMLWIAAPMRADSVSSRASTRSAHASALPSEKRCCAPSGCAPIRPWR